MNKTQNTGFPSETEIAGRVEALLAQLSLAEKVGQLNQIGGADFIPGPKPEDIIRQGGAGSVLWLNGTKKFNALQKSLLKRVHRKSRCCLPWM